MAIALGGPASSCAFSGSQHVRRHRGGPCAARRAPSRSRLAEPQRGPSPRRHLRVSSSEPFSPVGVLGRTTSRGQSCPVAAGAPGAPLYGRSPGSTLPSRPSRPDTELSPVSTGSSLRERETRCPAACGPLRRAFPGRHDALGADAGGSVCASDSPSPHGLPPSALPARLPSFLLWLDSPPSSRASLL